ncbi:hypothetical protein M885DRAFT_504341 [Pelagophyceae sp. CCMP2097]|nr:hypothetical protein M885DRAFT_504341 [Pelagophyceae sp. CCMP2097]|mmetsp:Transcript_25070/g.85899  ORF Transcript_25070/g.85899 Transcript_25070/m.85899 type:complete len:252 (-) Transcript_25070:48-803(-)
MSPHCKLALVCAYAGAFVAPQRRLAPQPQMRDAAAARSAPPQTQRSMLPFDDASLTTAYEFGGSYTSLYATLGLYAISFPGLYSLVKRATKVDLVQKKFVFAKDSEYGDMRGIATEVMGYMMANNYEVAEAADTITFKGKIATSKSQAFFLVFCTFIGLASLALVLQIQVPEVGGWWFLSTLISPYAGVYYWENAIVDNEFKIKLEASDDDSVTNLTVRGGKEDVERMARVMKMQEEGKVRVKGLLETQLK